MCVCVCVCVCVCSQFDLGMVYDEPEKCFIHKWLLLTDPDDPSAGTKVRTVLPSHTVEPPLPPIELIKGTTGAMVTGEVCFFQRAEGILASIVY